jgi:uncharacterized integral membrane protein
MSDNSAPPPQMQTPPVTGTQATFDVGGHHVALSGGVLAALGGAALLVIFMVQNTEEVTLEFLFWDFNWPLWFLVLLSAVVGALVWLGLGVLRRHRRRVDRRDARRA